jgi:Transposase DDE domain
MLLGKVFEPFVAAAPVCVMARGVLENILDPQRIDALFERTAEQQYTRDLTFSALVDLMSRVVLQIQPSVHAAYRAMAEQLGVSDQAVYDKLRHVEVGVSAELVRDSARQAQAVIDALHSAVPPLLPGFRTKILDGNHLAATEHRIEELRTTWAAALPGKLLVVLDQERMLATEVCPCEDGHAQERSLLDAVLAKVEARDLWLADRNFCTLKFLWEIAARLGFFLIRQHGTVKGIPLGQRQCHGRSSTGVVYEQKLKLTNSQGEEWVVRRITIMLDQPTRDGDMEIHLLSNVPLAQADAVQLAETYRQRWTIEIMFLEMTETLACEINTLGYPKAALFAFCLALMAYNAVSVLKAALRSVHGLEKIDEELSGYYVSLEIQQMYPGMMVAIPPRHWKFWRSLAPKEMASLLQDLAKKVQLPKYKKAHRGPKKKAPKRTAYKNGSHLSTAKILAGRGVT